MAIVCKSYHKHSKISEVYQLPKMAQNAQESSLPDPHFQSFPLLAEIGSECWPQLNCELPCWVGHLMPIFLSLHVWAEQEHKQPGQQALKCRLKFLSLLYMNKGLFWNFCKTQTVGWPLGHLGKPPLIHHYRKLSDIPEPYITWLYFVMLYFVTARGI